MKFRENDLINRLCGLLGVKFREIRVSMCFQAPRCLTQVFGFHSAGFLPKSLGSASGWLRARKTDANAAILQIRPV